MTDSLPHLDTAAVRMWAKAQGYAVGAKGRLPGGVIEAFLKARQADAEEHDLPGPSSTSVPAGRQEEPGDATDYPQYELLASYLEPQFGSIYAYNLNGGYPGEDPQPWTDEIREAICSYLLHELPDDVGAHLFGLDAEQLSDNEIKQTAVDAAMAGCEPWEVAVAVHDAAVEAVPTLDQLIGHLDTWPSEEECSDAMAWLEAHAGADELQSVVASSRVVSKLPWKSPGVWELTHDLEPPALLAVWSYVVGPAPGDMTDAEWRLVKPFLPTKRASASRLEAHWQSTRRAIDGMLYKSAEGVPWSRLPRRYGTGASLYQRYDRYLSSGVFSRMLEGIRDQPEAARIVQWLRQILEVRHSAAAPPVAPSDLTDDEWQLVRQFIPKRRRETVERHLQSARQALDGMLYRSAHGVSWSRIPPRYGTAVNIYMRHRVYLSTGVFGRMPNGLHDQAEAARIVAWLGRTKGGSRRRAGRRAQRHPNGKGSA